MKASFRHAVASAAFGCLSLLALDSAGAFAANGKIPVYGPTTISQPGAYYLTSDITNVSGVAITIAADHVTLDLAGHTITQQDTANVISATFHTGLKVYGGQINYAGSSANGASGVFVNGDGEYTLTDLNISGSLEFGIEIAGGGSTHVTIEHVTINDASGYGFFIQYIQGSRIEYNNVVNSGWGFYFNAVVSTVVAHNSAAHSILAGFNFGPSLSASLNVVRDNLASDTWSGDGYILSALTNSVIDGNTANGNVHCGFNFQSGASQNVYSNNRAIANTGGAYCGSTGQNTNAGGNF